MDKARVIHSAALAVLIATAVGSAILWPKAEPAPRRLTPVAKANADDPAQVALGQSLYKIHCASCHGARLQGEFGWKLPAADGRIKAPPQDASGHTYEHGDDELVAMIRLGQGLSEFMPRFAKTLDEAQTYAIVAYVKSNWPLAIRIAQAAANSDRAGMPAGVTAPEIARPGTCVATRRPGTPGAPQGGTAGASEGPRR
jgi:mono/diheme cytochrome c family protein